MDNSYFSDYYQKLNYILKVNSFFNSYKQFIKRIDIINNCYYIDLIFYINKNKFYFANGKFVPEHDIKNIDKYASYFNNYEKNSNKKINNFIYFKSHKWLLFEEIYGKNKNEVMNNLIEINFLNKKIKFNKKNKASTMLENVSNEILILSQKNNQIKDWINSIYTIETFNYRNVKNEDRLSLHSFGIAIDIITKNNKKNIYWLWSLKSKKEWWNILDMDKMYIPEEVIKIFEKYGFCWGGKWIKFDIMHFEYRPEILGVY